ncbi:MAG: hypothetical protein Q8N35_07435 [Methylococcaceae bacterium]|nr:hypothetical protein [Methylococcaceae bacterium]MDZ4155444.1 hypothetical protein [Methylococcales bacterium]MDP2394306.1 hypothetical protein [Methylococcaceae bacterium]MDP3019401.1 hypothetical protein [Methylococcaceae bacterium]MDP3390655.1 hypothetical protein [Methylococcaceae bacterium]
MNLLFWKKKEKQSLDTLCWNLMFRATDPDRCWDMASMFRKTSIPGNVLTCETSFLMGSIVRDIIRATVPAELQRQALMSAEAAYFKSFDDESENELPQEMADVYGKIRLGNVARTALSEYGEQNDNLLLTSSIFIHRINGDPRMKHEVIPIFKDRQITLRNAFAKLA